MNTTYHSQYWAHALTLRGSGGDIAALSRSIANARVDLNPHQIDAALFALRSPFTNGAILADEVGLGKTVEAGIVLSQKWAERRRRILIVVPAMLRKQWQQELSEKFFIPSEVLDSQVVGRLRKNGGGNPFDQKDKAVICSYNFAAAKAAAVAQLPWDMVVIDEAHRLRNVHRSRNIADANPKMDHAQNDGVVALSNGSGTVNRTQQLLSVRRCQTSRRQNGARLMDSRHDKQKVANINALHPQEPEVTAQRGTSAAPSAVGTPTGQRVHICVNALRSDDRRIDRPLLEAEC